MFPTGNGPGTSNNTMSNQQMYRSMDMQYQPIINNQATSCSILQPPLSQQMPTNYFVPLTQQPIIPTQQQLISRQQQPIPLYNETLTGCQIQTMSSTSEDEEETQEDTTNTWQVMRGTKRRKCIKPKTITGLETRNRYQLLTNQTDTSNGNSTNTIRPPKPPPIFVHGVINYNEMVKQIQDIAEDEQYYTKTLANNVVKINCSTPDTYRKLVRHFKEKNIYHHTYQLKEERAFRIVIKYLHHSTSIENIKQELFQLGHTVRNIINVRHRITKEPLNTFFVDLEPSDNNKDIYKVTGLQNRIIQIEPPHSNKRNIIQCMRCQQYGHSKTYCNKPHICVKCGGSHNTKECKKPKDSPATCALCGGDHPASYKGCEHYHNLTKNTNKKKQATTMPPINLNAYTQNTQPTTFSQRTSYADITRQNINQTEDMTTALTKFLEEFRGLFNQLLQQNSMVLNMLTMLIDKLH